jgi:AmmeMemoRadiSam system protein B
MNTSLTDIRPSPIAGRWYPGDPQQLARSIDDFIADADVSPFEGRVVGILAPHAGHVFSGPVAGYAFKFVQGMDVDVVALVGPSHHPYSAAIITSGHDAYQTPLGTVPIDREALDTLRKTVPIDAVRDDPEHCLEIELPFLQRTLGAFRLIPLALLDQSLDMATKLGEALADLLADQKALLVASSDLSHFHPQQIANKYDQQVLEAITDYDPVRVIQAEAHGQKIACGHGAIAAIMIAARALGADSAQVVNYATSGNVNRDFGRVVGYGAALFYESEPAQAGSDGQN